jgi:drug/metabolite transporter (DMT)-like permease
MSGERRRTLPGEAYALACAFLWATSSALIKSQTHKMHVVLLGALRTVPALSIYWVLLLFSGRAGEFLQLPPRACALLAGSTLVGLVAGDLLYFQSMKLIGLSRALPLSTIYPLFTVLLAFLFLDEQLGWATVGGAVLIAAGAYLLAVPRKTARIGAGELTREVNLAGVAMAFAAALCWSASTVMLRMGLEGVDATLANVIRLSVLMIVLLLMSLRRGRIGQVREYGLRTLGIVFLAGVVGTGLGTFAFLTAVQRAGAARTSILTATTPLFGVPLALFLKEKPSVRTLLGTALAIGGVWLTIH